MILNFLKQQHKLNKPNTDEKDQSKQNIDECKDNNNITKEVLNADITKNQEVTEVEYTNTLVQLLSSETTDSNVVLNLETNITKNNIVTDLFLDYTVTPGSKDIPNEKKKYRT